MKLLNRGLVLRSFLGYIYRGVAGLPAAIIPILFGVAHSFLIISLVILVIVDTCLGFCKGWNGVGKKLTSSEKFRAFTTKVISYGAAIIVSWQIEKYLIFKEIDFKIIVFSITEFIIIAEAMTEILSIVENLGQLGFKIPKILAKHLEVLKDFDTRNRD